MERVKTELYGYRESIEKDGCILGMQRLVGAQREYNSLYNKNSCSLENGPSTRNQCLRRAAVLAGTGSTIDTAAKINSQHILLLFDRRPTGWASEKTGNVPESSTATAFTS